MSTTTHIDRKPCNRCGTWYWTGDEHTCPVPGPTPEDVVAAAFPDHGRMVPWAAGKLASLAGQDYRDRIAAEDAFYLEVYGVPVPTQEAA